MVELPEGGTTIILVCFGSREVCISTVKPHEWARHTITDYVSTKTLQNLNPFLSIFDLLKIKKITMSKTVQSSSFSTTTHPNTL